MNTLANEVIVNLKTALVVCDLNGNVLLKSNISDDILGFNHTYSLTEYSNRLDYYDPVTKEIIDPNNIPLAITLRTGNPVINFLLMLKDTKTNNELHLLVNSYPIMKNNKMFAGAVEFVDVTEEHQYKEMIERFSEKLEELTVVLKQSISKSIKVS